MTASTADQALQQVIYDTLIATIAVTDQLADGVNGVYDAVPDGADLPFIVIGDNELSEGELKGCERWIGKVTINVHTQQGKGPGTPPPPVVQAKLILEAVQGVIDESLAPVGYDIIVLAVDFLGTSVNPTDEKSVTGRTTYRLDMTENASVLTGKGFSDGFSEGFEV